MAVKASIDGKDISGGLSSLTSTEDATPLRFGDESPAGVGSFSLGASWRFEEAMYQRGRTLTASFERFGGVRGKVTAASGGTGATVTLSGESLLGAFVVQVKAKPFQGTLRNAMLYYMRLVGISTPLVIENIISGKQVVLPGFVGNLWEILAKEIAPVIGFEISAANNTIQVRRPRRLTGSLSRELSGPAWSQDAGFLATRIEVAYYGRTWHPNTLIYPGPQIFTGEEEIISVDAGQTVEVILEVPYSVDSLQEPRYVEWMDMYGVTGAYTAIGSDNLPVTPAFWSQNGGRLVAVPGDEPNQIKVSVTAPSIEYYAPYRLAMSDGENEYSALRIRGAGVLVDRQQISVETGLGESTDAVTTHDSIMVGTRAEAYEIAVAALSRHLGNRQRIDGNVASFARPAGGSLDGVENQVSGNVAGTRLRAYEGVYRITNATISPSNVSYSAVMDTTVDDTRALRAGQTINQSNTEKANARIRDVNATPLRKDWR